MYLVAILLPPLAVFLCGKPFQAILNLVLMVTILGWPFAAIHAVLVVNGRNADRRTQRLIEATKAAAASISASAEARPAV